MATIPPKAKENNIPPTPLTTSALIWAEGRALLAGVGPKRDSLIGRWIKQAGTDAGRTKLLAIIRSAAKTGTGDPAAYVTKGLNTEFPPRPRPTTLDRATWQRNRDAAIKTKQWSSAWGPPPGKPGCKMPPDLATPQLTAALAARRIAI